MFESQSSNNFNDDYPTDTDGSDSDSLETYVPVMSLSYYGTWASSGSAAVLNFVWSYRITVFSH